MSNSDRAIAANKSMPRDPTDREQLREVWRMAAMASVLADDAYHRAREGRQIFLDEIVGELMDANRDLKLAAAERLARTSDAYKDYVTTMHDLRRRSDEMKITAADADRKYWENVSHEANTRAEMRMTGAAR